MCDIYQQNMISDRTARMRQLFDDNLRYTSSWRKACDMREVMTQYLDDEMYKLESSQLYANHSSVAIPVMEHLKELINRYLTDLQISMENFDGEIRWLNDNIYKFDSYHSCMWGHLMKQSGQYENLINDKLWRYMDTLAIFVEIGGLL